MAGRPKERAAAAAAAAALVAAVALVVARGGSGAAPGALFAWSTRTDPIFSDSGGDTVMGVDADDPNFNIKDLDYDSPFERMTGAEETRCPMCAGQKEYHTYLHSLERGGDATDVDSPQYRGEERERDPAFEDGRGRVPAGRAAGARAAQQVVSGPVSGPKGALQRMLASVMQQMEIQAREYRITDVDQRREAAAARLLNKKRLLLKKEQAEVQDDMKALAAAQAEQIGGLRGREEQAEEPAGSEEGAGEGGEEGAEEGTGEGVAGGGGEGEGAGEGGSEPAGDARR